LDIDIEQKETERQSQKSNIVSPITNTNN